MGIINMMIVIPQLLQTLSFGASYSHFLNATPANALRFAAIFLAIAAVAMLWINDRKDGAGDLTH